MCTKYSMLALGTLAGVAGLLWIRRRYVNEKNREQLLKNEQDVESRMTESTSVAHSNVDKGIPEMTDTLTQCPSTKLREGFIPLDEICLTERQRKMINREIQKPSVNPLDLLNQIIPGIRYEHKIISNQPTLIRVDTIIYGRSLSAYGPTKKDAKLLISFMAMYLFYGYKQQDLMYQPRTSAAESNVDHGIPTANTSGQELLCSPSTSAAESNVDHSIPTANTSGQELLCSPSTSAAESNVDHSIPTANTIEQNIEHERQSTLQTHRNNRIPKTNLKRRYFIEKKVFYREKDILHKPRSSAYQTNKVNDIHATTDEILHCSRDKFPKLFIPNCEDIILHKD